MGKFIYNSSLESCFPQASDFAGGIWQTLHEKSYALDAALEHKMKVSDEFARRAQNGEMTTVTKQCAEREAIRALAFQEARMLLRQHLLCCIDRTMAAIS